MGLPPIQSEQRRYVSCPRPANYAKEQDWPISVEMQFLALGDGLPRPTGNMCSPGTEIVYEGKQYNGHCLNSNSKTYGKDEWVKAELIVWGDSLVQHIINGDTVLQYGKPSMGGGVANRYNPAVWQPGKPLLPKVTLPCRVKGNRSHFATCF